LHAKTPAEKRPREDTPSPEKTPERSQEGKDWHRRVQDDVEWAKGQIGKAAQGFKTDKIVNLGESVKDFLNVTLVNILVRQANTSSDLVSEVIRLNKENARLNNLVEKQGEDITGVKLCKDKVEVKASRKEMEEKIKVAATQVKVVDLDVGKEISDRKELQAAAKEALAAKVRSDLRKSYEEKIKGATFKVIASKTFKVTCEGKDSWTVPVLITIPDRESRWEMESCLRSSKVFPGFHWPREMVDNVKIYRQVVKDLGYSDATHYIRIRPEDRDGTWKIRADVKPKDSTGRFISVASFDIPPMDNNLKKHVSGWATPTWTRKADGRQTGSGASAAAAATYAAATAAAMDFTEDVTIDNL
jgi:hypothetical protein